VLLKRREEDKAELEEKVTCNIRELILPYVENLKMTSVDSHQLNQLNILESNLNEIVSPFLRTLSSKYPNLTPMEIKVINFVKEGRTTKRDIRPLECFAQDGRGAPEQHSQKTELKQQKGQPEVPSPVPVRPHCQETRLSIILR